jgi:hypothetical protein
MITPEQLDERIRQSERLSHLRDQLTDEIQFRADDSAMFDPITIIMIISIIVQIVIHCREHRTDDEILRDMQEVRTLPRYRLIRLRLRLNRLWHECCAGNRPRKGDRNPLLTAVYELAERADPDALQDIIDLAKE